MSASLLLPTLAQETLGQSPLPALRLLKVEETDREVVIRGRVSSYYLKQLAQEAVRPVLGQRKLINHVIVNRDAE